MAFPSACAPPETSAEKARADYYGNMQKAYLHQVRYNKLAFKTVGGEVVSYKPSNDPERVSILQLAREYQKQATKAWERYQGMRKKNKDIERLKPWKAPRLTEEGPKRSLEETEEGTPEEAEPGTEITETGAAAATGRRIKSNSPPELGKGTSKGGRGRRGGSKIQTH